MTLFEVLHEVDAEIKRAREKFPDWPVSEIEGAAIVVEEAGEVVQAALNRRPHDPHFADTPREKVKKELIQTAAMAVRMLVDGRY